MEKSLFVEFASKFTQLAKAVVERINGKKTALTYLHKEMLTPELSIDLKWQTLNVDGSVVSADVVSMDSPLPLKKRDSFGTASGDIPKLGMKLALNEKTISDIEVLKARNVESATIVGKLFADTQKCIIGVYEKLEYIFLLGLSTGVALIDDDTNVGTGIRIDYGYPAANSFGAVIPWSDITNSKPIDDIKRVIKEAKAKGNVPSILMMDESTFDSLAANAQTREQYAFSQGFVGTNIPIPDLEQVNTMLQKRYKLTIVIVDRVVVTERDGVRTNRTPWAANKIVFLENIKVGKLVYGILAEESHKNLAVSYDKLDNFILVKKWHSTDPFAEFTSSQALVLPVINNVDSIYLLDVEEAQTTSGQTESNATITIYADSTVTVDNLVNALTAVGVTANSSMTDVELIKLVNKLSKAKETTLIAILEIPVVNAGTDTTSSSATKALLGTATAAGDKTIVSTLWSQVSGPNTAGFSAATALSTNATGLITGTYVFKLTATDSEGTIASDTISVVATVA